MTYKPVQFQFRLWVNPEDGDPSDLEVWHTEAPLSFYESHSITDWIRESILEEDFSKQFGLDLDKYYLVTGKGTVSASRDCEGEWDQDLTFDEFEKVELKPPVDTLSSWSKGFDCPHLTMELIGHPWDEKDKGFITQVWEASTHKEAEETATSMANLGWSIWLVSNTGYPGFVVYKERV